MTKPIILVDGFSLVFRAYHALLRTGMQANSGEPTFAVFAFINILTSLLDKHSPEAFAVVFDTSAPTFRHEMFDQYKAHRDAFPDDLVPQLARIKQMIEFMGLQQLELPGFEADDIVGTIAKRESADGHDVLCVTSDKDYFQLVTDKVKVLRPGRDAGEYEVFDAERVKEKFGVKPEHVIDVLALIGDASDNIPGVKGVGEKTAIPLIEQYDTIENIYANLESIEKASLRKKLESSREMAMLSKTLVTIHTDVPLVAKRESLIRMPMNFAAIDALCAELGFHSLRRKFQKYAVDAGEDVIGAPLPDDSSAPSAADDGDASDSGFKRLADIDHEYSLVDSWEGIDAMLAELALPQLLSVDLETTSLNAMQCGIVGIALCAKEGRAFYISVVDPADTGQESLFGNDDKNHGLPVGEVIERLRPLLHDAAVGKVGQNLKYDALILRRHGIVVHPIAFDTMLASYIIDPDKQHGLDAISQRWLQYQPIPITDLIGVKKGAQISMREVPPETVAEYAGEDADLAFTLMGKLMPVLQRDGLIDLAKNIEFPVEEVLVAMEFNGIAVDTSALGELGAFMREEAARLEIEIWKEAGQEFTINSPKQLAEILFDKMMLPAQRKTKTGYSTDAAVLSELSEMYPIAQMVLDYRQVEKLRSTYVESLPRIINPSTGRVHTTYNQTVAATGRLSSTEPNLQNIPVRTELGLRIRKAFVPQNDNAVILSADYSQIELRIMAAISQDPGLVQAFASGADVHAATAALLFDTTIELVTSDQRRVAKTVNFGIMYGQGAFGLSQGLGISRTEAQLIIDNYFVKYAGIKKYIDDTVALTRDRGYATTLLGRRRYFPTILSNNRGLRTAAERAAVNMPIQGTAADMMKIAMIRVHQRMQDAGMKSLLMLQVHDELVFEAFTDELVDLRSLVVEEMSNAYPLDGVPVIVDSGFGSSWYEAK